jgi:hypothetical protein
MFEPEILGLFDPRSLGVHINQNFPDHILAYLHSSLEEIQAAIPTHSTEDCTALVRLFTTVNHELKHFHDAVGTPFGYSHSSARLHREEQLCRFLQSMDEIKLPMSDWAKEVTCPEEVKQFCNTQYSEWLSSVSHFYGQSFPAPNVPDSNLIRQVVPPNPFPGALGDQPFPEIPVFNPGKELCEHLRIQHQYFPLTALVIMEGAAINTQSLQVYDLFGNQVAQQFHSSIHDQAFRSGLWVYTITSDLTGIIAKGYGWSNNEILKYQVADFCLTGRCRDGVVAATDSPGFRFAELASFGLNKTLAKKSSRRKFSAQKCQSLLDDFRDRKFGEPPLSQILSEHASMLRQSNQTDLARIKSVEPENIAEGVIRHAKTRLADLYSRMLDFRLRNPDVFLEPIEYLVRTPELPFPPNHSRVENYVLHYPDGMLDWVDVSCENCGSLPDEKLWRLYYAISSILEQIQWSSAPRCAFRQWNVPCPAATGEGEGLKANPAKRCLCQSAASAVGLYRDRFIVPWGEAF